LLNMPAMPDPCRWQPGFDQGISWARFESDSGSSQESGILLGKCSPVIQATEPV